MACLQSLRLCNKAPAQAAARLPCFSLGFTLAGWGGWSRQASPPAPGLLTPQPPRPKLHSLALCAALGPRQEHRDSACGMLAEVAQRQTVLVGLSFTPECCRKEPLSCLS